jgi:hypothetical protein
MYFLWQRLCPDHLRVASTVSLSTSSSWLCVLNGLVGYSGGFLLAFLGLSNKGFDLCQQQTARISWSRYSLFAFNLKLVTISLFAAGEYFT